MSQSGESRLLGGDKLLGAVELDREQLRHALLRHRHAKETVHPAHRDWVVGDGDELGVR